MDITAPIQPPEQRRRRRRGGFLLRFFGFLFAASMIVFVAVAGAAAFVLWKVSKDLPDYEVLAKYEPPVMTRIHANDGNLIAEFARERRIYVPFSAIPDRVTEAFISAEDKNFYQHGGLDIQGILRAAVTNLSSAQSGRRMVGASTITQQVAKNLFLWQGRDFVRKALEFPLALWIDLVLPKARILEIYLNIAELGPQGQFGVETASAYAFGKSAANLSPREAALLASILPNPVKRSARTPGPGVRRLAGTYVARAQANSLLTCWRENR